LSGATTAATIAAPLAAVASSTVIGAIPSLIGAAAVTGLGAIAGGLTEWFKDNTARNARGGLATIGKLNVFGEGGPEAAVPLPDGKSIPVTIQTPMTMPVASDNPKETTAISAPAMPQQPTPAFSTQRLELTGIDNIENMARSFVERPTDRLDAGFTQFLADLKMTLDTTNVLQAPQPVVPMAAEVPEATALRETIEKTSAVLSDLMREHTSLMRENLAIVNDLVSVSSDTKNINQQLLNNSY
jgi:hypothetical protein